MRVAVYLNTHPDNFSGYEAGHPLATADDLHLTFDRDDPQRALSAAFAVGNRQGEDDTGHAWPADMRSVSVGDVMWIDDAWYSVDRTGFTEIEPPTGFVPIGGQRRVTSRPRPQSGYTPCACRDCPDLSISSDVTRPELCLLCKDADCEPNAGECQREDAYTEG